MKRKILLSGRMPNYTDEQLEKISLLGLEIIHWPKEHKLIEEDVSDIEIVAGFDVLNYNKIERFTNLQFIQLSSAGYEHMPVDYIKKHKIILANARGAFSIAIAEMVIAKLLEIYKSGRQFYNQQRHHIWKPHHKIDEIMYKTIAIVGYGSIGNEIAMRLHSFGCEIHAIDIQNPNSQIVKKYYHMDNLDQALANSDVVISALPLNEKTRFLFNKQRFSQFKNNSVFINISRGDIVDQTALYNALKKDQLRAAVLDVFNIEPLPRLSRMWDLKNLYITPHNSYLSINSERRLYELIYQNILNYLTQQPITNRITFDDGA